MSNIVRFPVKPRIASNDANPWLSSEGIPSENPKKKEAVENPIYAKPRKVVDKLSGVEYIGYVVEDEKKPCCRSWRFVLAVIGWLLLFVLI